MKTTAPFFSRALLGATLLALVLFVSACDSTEPDEDDGAGEQELITRVVLTMTPAGGGEAVTITAADEDGDGEGLTFDPEALTLQTGTTYDGAIELFDDPNDEEITEEIQEEADEHLFRYTGAGGLADRLTVTLTDAEADYSDDGREGVPVGLAFQVDVSEGDAATGTLNATLFHFDEGAVKEDGTSVSNERDIDIDFPVGIEAGNVTAADVTISVDNVGASAWVVNSVEGSDGVAVTGEENTTLTLAPGTRYRINSGGLSAHPFAFQDDAENFLLVQNFSDAEGSFENDPDVNFISDGDGITFTLTKALADEIAVYLCTIHPGSMNGAVSVAGDGGDSNG